VCVAAGLVAGRVPSVVRGELPLERLVVGVGNATYALGPAAVFLAFGEPDAHLKGWAVLAVALLAQGAVDWTSSIAREWLALRVPPRELVRPLASAFAIDALLAPVGLSAAVGALSTEAALVLPLPLLGLIAFFAGERRRRLDHSLELSSAYRGTALLLGDVIDNDDAYTGSHSRAVVDLVLGVAGRLGLDARERRAAEFAALLHDVGKIRIPTAIIVKPGPLTPDERELINTHTVEGERMLRSIGGLLAEVGGIVRSCHERFDGGGYPDGLAGEEIPLIARIVCCCDAYNAMTTDRPYRGALTHEAAVAELRAGRGTQFDPAVVDALLAELAVRSR
jgi:HD-GYP domain-containing protein (c-di-GMP phosphodiesterase class II)